MDAINQDILKKLQEYAQKYFVAIVELNSTDGECNLKPGKYSAKDLNNRCHNGPLGYYAIPDSEEYDGNITATAGTFKCRFPYRRIFAVLADWETMCKAGKQKAVFEIGEVEEKSAKVLVNDKTILGAFKTKTMKLQRIGGNWWGQPKEIQKEGSTTGYYELNGVMFAPGKTFWGNPRKDANKAFTDKFGDADMIKLIVSFIGKHDNENIYCEYINEVASMAGVELPTVEEVKPTPKDREEIKQEWRNRNTTEPLMIMCDGESKGRVIFRSVDTDAEYSTPVKFYRKDDGKISYAEIGEPVCTKEATETSQISTEAAETVNMSAEGEKESETKINEETRQYIVDTYKTKENLTAKFSDAIGSIATQLEEYRTSKRKGGRMRKENIMRLEEQIKLLCAQLNEWSALFDAPQSPETPQASNYTTMPEKRATEPQNEPKQVIRIFRTTEPRTCKKFLIVANVPRIVPRRRHQLFHGRCFTECHFIDIRKMVCTPQGCSPPDRHPPIRGDCVPVLFTRQTTRINKLQRINLRL